MYYHVQNSQGEVALWHREISSVLCDDPEGRDGVGEGGKLKREGNMTGGFQEMVITTVYQALHTD